MPPTPSSRCCTALPQMSNSVNPPPGSGTLCCATYQPLFPFRVTPTTRNDPHLLLPWQGVVCTGDEKVAFTGADAVILLGAFPRKVPLTSLFSLMHPFPSFATYFDAYF